ncbi:MAG: 50S ribosomal protein L4, partial [Planctomycetaceae bacterium]|nr:50S ribosomal protein L4 [Planctomycetaceae bacterium]
VKTARRATIVLAQPNENVFKSFRNFPRVEVRLAVDLCAHDVLNGGLILAEAAALDALAQRVGGKTGGAA